MGELFVGYIPVIHDGYLKAFERHPEAAIGVLDQSILEQYDYLRKDIRALSPETAQKLISGLGRAARLISLDSISDEMRAHHIIMPDDDISHDISAKHTGTDVEFEPVFLRWDRRSSDVNQSVTPDRTIDPSQVPGNMTELLYDTADRSTNWWRHVAAAIGHDDSILDAAYNQSLPTEYSSWIDSDPRITAKRGEAIEKSIDIHAEAKLIADAAKRGERLDGMDIYVTTFPCPNCAKLIVRAGIKRCYFVEGYAMLDGYTVLKANGIEIIKIETEPVEPDSRQLKPYPSSS